MSRARCRESKLAQDSSLSLSLSLSLSELPARVNEGAHERENEEEKGKRGRERRENTERERERERDKERERGPWCARTTGARRRAPRACLAHCSRGRARYPTRGLGSGSGERRTPGPPGCVSRTQGRARGRYAARARAPGEPASPPPPWPWHSPPPGAPAAPPPAPRRLSARNTRMPQHARATGPGRLLHCFALLARSSRVFCLDARRLDRPGLAAASPECGRPLREPPRR